MNISFRIKGCFSFFFILAAASAFAQDIAPVVTASGNQVYCPGSTLNIVTSFNITDPDDTTTDAIYIQIAAGYENGQDLLSLSTTIPNVTTSWNAAAGKLTISGVGGQELAYTTLINAVQNVVYSSSAANPSGVRTFSITVGEANYLPSTGHYYKFVSQPGISWNAAKTAAQNSTYYGLQGYLATLLAIDEAQLCGEQTTGTGWIGGSDATTEGVWKWMTGPEAGTTFWNGGVNGSSPNFAFWNTGEPNNQGEEDYAHITAPGVGIAGSWNDLPMNGSGGQYAPMGYIVEYGGMPGDPVLQISASTTISHPDIISTIPATGCGTSSVILGAVTNYGIVHWYDAPTGGTELATGSSFTTPQISVTTTYYASPFGNACTASRTAVTATINNQPAITAATPVTICGGGTAILQATPSEGTVKWYVTPSGGTAIGTGNTFSQTVNTNMTFYAEAVSTSGCASAARTAVSVIVTPVPTVSAASPVSICGAGTVTLQATPSAGTVNWYDQPTGGNVLGSGSSITSPQVTQDTTFYAEAVNNGCTSARQAVDVTIVPMPVITATSPVYICTEGTTTLTATATTGTITWYDAAQGGNMIGTGGSITSPYLTQTTTFYAEADNSNGCLTATRTAVEAIVTPLPVITLAPTVTACEGTTTTLAATASAGTVNWYTDATGGTPIGTGSTIESPIITADTIFYAEASDHGCTSASREAVAVTMFSAPTVQDRIVFMCQDGAAVLNAAQPGMVYQWSTGEETAEIVALEPGEYTVQVTNATACSATQTFTVIERQAPVIDMVGVGGSTIKVLMENTDTGNFEYSIDGINYQQSNTFSNLPVEPGVAYVREIHGCGMDSGRYLIFIVPKYFTPNNDSVNDIFTIADMAAYPEAKLTIFDRYGKIITSLSQRNRSWDGTYNGHPLPATDYWYVLKLDNATPEIKGHFSLMR